VPASREVSNRYVVLVGDDRVGARVLEELCALGVSVTGVCSDPEAPFVRAARAAQVPLVIGDPRSEDTLRQANVADASACALIANADLTNLHAALQLEELAPTARLVVRLFNTSLAGAVGRLAGRVTVLSAEEIAAPGFVEAALRGGADFRLRVGHRQIAVQEVDGSDRRLWLALADAGADDGELEPFPLDAARVIGLVDLGPAQAAERAEPAGALDLRIAQRSQGLFAVATTATRAGWLLLRTVVGILDRRLVVVGLLFSVVLALSALVFDGSLGVGLLDSLYFVVTTVTTTGYGDITVIEEPARLKLFTILLMLLGGLMLALVFALVTDAVVGARLARALGQYPMPRSDHVVVVGLGRTGTLVIHALIEADVPCVVVERDETGLDRALLRRHRIPLVLGDAGSEETLDLLRLHSARALMAMTDDEVANLQCALLARSRVPHLRVVLRLADPDLATRIERASGLELSRGVSTLASPAFVAAILGRRATAVLPVGREVMQIVGLTAELSTDVQSLERGCDARVLEVNGIEFPVLDARVVPGDEVLVVGTGQGLAELERRIVRTALTRAVDGSGETSG
jgi:Trk K+ transport system NAD-binding subunit